MSLYLNLIESYHDNATIADLQEMIGSQKELDRLNAHLKENLSQDNLDIILVAAIRLREETGNH